MSSIKKAKDHVQDSLFYPIMFVVILWAIKVVELMSSTSFAGFGVLPRNTDGMIGILTYPLIHGNARAGDVLGNFSHLFSNSVPLIVLGFIILHSYRRVAWRSIAIIWVGSGLLVWLFANPFSLHNSYHIGASGLVYGLAFFVFFSGVFRKDVSSIALALLVAFLYGGIVWGVLPLQEGVSWEGHLGGAIMGVLSAYYFRGIGKVPKKYWEDEPEEDQNNIVESPFWVKSTPEKKLESTVTSKDYTDIPIKSAEDVLDWEVKYKFVPKKKNKK
ncbi:MAG: rhomboid family intramembrane serine protease [Chitinophagales bacterium]